MADIQRWTHDEQLIRMWEIIRERVYLAPEIPNADMALALNQIQREFNDGHVAAVAAAEQRVLDEERTKEKWFCSEEDKQALIAHGVQAARDAVAGLPVLLVDVRFNPDDASRYVGAVNVSDALAAIDALLGESNG